MLDSEMKRRIDAARDILVGKVPNPISQVDMITTAMIYKFMDDMDRQSVELGGKIKFFSGSLKNYAWHILLSSKQGNQNRINLYGEALSKLQLAQQVPPLFRNIFKDAFLPFRDGETLSLFLKEIDFFSYIDDSENLGNAFEYLLSILGSQGDAGSFRTPRRIIDFIVSVINPQKTDKILDPACGTAGFLISSYKHILNSAKKKLSPCEMKQLANNIMGYDIDPTMVKLSLVNLYLHNFQNPQIFEYDALTSDQRWDDKFDVILANPPFMTPKGGIRPHGKFAISANRSEALFVDYIAEHLTFNGRAGVIVPEGIIFKSEGAYKALRKMLIDENYLYAVVSLPAGIFQPYSGVKTSILLLDRKLAKKNNDILFIKIENDGFTLGAQRKPIDKNDLPNAAEIIKQYQKDSEKFFAPTKDKDQIAGADNHSPAVKMDMSLSVPKQKIIDGGDYNLTMERYRITEKKGNQKWEMAKLGDVCEIISGQSPDGRHYNEYGKGTPFYQGKTEFTEMYLGNPTKWTTQETKIAEKDDILMSVRAPVGPVNIATQRICIGRGLTAIRASDKILLPFLFSLLKLKEIKGNGGAIFDSINRNDIERIVIPLPPIEVQKQIISEIEQYQKIIDGARQVIENWKPQIKINPNWQVVKLGDVCEITSSKRVFESEWQNTGIPFYRAREIVKLSNNGFIDNELFITEKMFDDYSKKYGAPQKDDLMITAVGTLGICYRVRKNDKFYFKDGNIIWLKDFIKNVNPAYIECLFKSDIVKNQIKLFSVGGTVGTYTIINAKKTKIPLPPIKIQQEIIQKIESERKSVDSCRELIKIYEAKIKDVIDKIWN